MIKKVILALVTFLIVAAVVVLPRTFSKDEKHREIQSSEQSKTVYQSTKAKENESKDDTENETLQSVEMKDGVLSWTEVPNVKEYSIYRAASKDGEYQKIGVTSGTSYTDESSLPGVTYYYKYGYKIPADTSSSSSEAQSKDTTTAKYSKKATSTKAATTVTTSKPTTVTTKVSPDTEQYMLDLINAERQKNDVPPLSFDSQLTKLARIRAKELAEKYDPTHLRPDGRDWVTIFNEEGGYSFGFAGENIAYGQRTVDEVMNSWYNSAGHYSNMVNSNYKHVGIAWSEKNGVRYWEQLFTD